MSEPVSTASEHFDYSHHAIEMLSERKIERAWVEQTVLQPDTVEQDSRHSDRTRAFRAMPERDGRVLRVVYARSGSTYRIVTLFLDRKKGRGR